MSYVFTIALSVLKAENKKRSQTSPEMENSIQKTMLPLSVCCVIFGFYTVDVKKTKFRRITTAYCVLVTILVFTSWTAFTVIKLQTMQYCFFNVTFLLMEIVQITMITYYSVKYIVCDNVVSEIFQNIDYADMCLERLGVKVPHKKDQVECAVYTVVTNLMCIIFAYLATGKREVQVRVDMVGELYAVYNFVTKFSVGYSSVMLLSQFTFLLYIVKQRIGLLRCAVQRSKKYFDRKIAWSRHVSISVLDVSIRVTSATERRNCFIEIQKIDDCIYNALCSIRNFYNHYYMLCVIFFILATTCGLLFSAIIGNTLQFAYVAVWHTLLLTTPVALCMNIQRDFQAIQTIINKFYWSNKLSRLDLNTRHMKHWMLQCLHKELKFDCGYFILDRQLLSIVFNFVSLLLFAMLPLYI